MKNTKLVLMVGLLAMSVSVSHATGTTAGTTIANTATIAYSVSGVAQTAIVSNTASYLVDRKVLFTLVKADGAYVSVVPGQTGAVLKYTLLNSGNSVQDFGLAVTQQSAAAVDAFGGADTIDTSSSSVFVDANGNSTYEAGTDTATYVDELAADTSVTIFVVSTLPASAANNDIAGIKLTATAEAGGAGGTQGAVLVNGSGSADVAGTVDVVFADAAGTGGDAANDGTYSAIDAYKVVSAALVVTKTSSVLTDPVNLTVNPKRIPGATIQYSISIVNNGSASATSVAISDVHDANTTFVSGSIVVDGVAQADNGSTGNGSYTLGTRTAAGSFATLAAAATKVMTFKVTQN